MPHSGSGLRTACEEALVAKPLSGRAALGVPGRRRWGTVDARVPRQEVEYASASNSSNSCTSTADQPGWRPSAPSAARVGEVLAEGQPESRDLLRELPVGTRATSVSLPAIGFRLNGDSLQPQQAPRNSGQDNDKYLT